MKKSLIILPFVISVFTASCQNVETEKKIQNRYQVSFETLKPVMVDHFPEQLPDSSIFLTTFPKKDHTKMFGFAPDMVILCKTYSQSQYQERKHHFQGLSNNIYTSDDSSLLLIFSYADVIEIDGMTYSNQESPQRQELAKHNVNMASSLPVPIFNIDEYKSNTRSGLPLDFKIHVLTAKPGKFIDEKYLEECECLPDKWKHGYSKGVAMSDEKNTVIYYLFIW